jgi:hypothetical protein
MNKGFNKLLILIVLFSLIIPQSVLADNPNSQPSNSKEIKQLVIAYADCWRNSANKWTDTTGYDGKVYPKLQPDGSPIEEYNVQVGFIGNLSVTPQLLNVEAAPSQISQELYDSFENKDNIVIANTGYGKPIHVPNKDKLNDKTRYTGTIGNISFTQSGNNANITLHNINLVTTHKDKYQAVPSGISGEYLPNHTGNAPTVQGRRIFFPLIVTWKVANVPDFKVWIGSKDIGNKLPGEMITIDCSVKNLSGTLEKTDIGVAEYGSGWNPPTVHGPLVDIPIDGNNYNFSFQMPMPTSTKMSASPVV